VAALLLQRDGWDVIASRWTSTIIRPVTRDREGTCCVAGRPVRRPAGVRPPGDPLLRPQPAGRIPQGGDRSVRPRVQGGRTPNPCILCNEHLKFRALLRKADELGAEGVATGHYAVIRTGPDGRCRLFTSPDARKDQSYFLYSLDSERLAAGPVPRGEMMKERVRRSPSARAAGVREAGEPGHLLRHRRLLHTVPGEPGDQRGPRALRGPGRELPGEPQGILHYTVGQRKGIGIASKEPLYVVAIDAEKNEVVLGSDGRRFPGGRWSSPRPSFPALPRGRSSARRPGYATTTPGRRAP